MEKKRQIILSAWSWLGKKCVWSQNPYFYNLTMRHIFEFLLLLLLWSEYFCSPHPNVYVAKQMSKMMLLRGGANGRWLGHEGKVLLNGISAVIKEASESSWALFMLCEDMVRILQPKTFTWPCLAPSSGTFNLQNCAKYISVVYNPPKCFLVAA